MGIFCENNTKQINKRCRHNVQFLFVETASTYNYQWATNIYFPFKKFWQLSIIFTAVFVLKNHPRRQTDPPNVNTSVR